MVRRYFSDEPECQLANRLSEVVLQHGDLVNIGGGLCPPSGIHNPEHGAEGGG